MRGHLRRRGPAAVRSRARAPIRRVAVAASIGTGTGIGGAARIARGGAAAAAVHVPPVPVPVRMRARRGGHALPVGVGVPVRDVRVFGAGREAPGGGVVIRRRPGGLRDALRGGGRAARAQGRGRQRPALVRELLRARARVRALEQAALVA